MKEEYTKNILGVKRELDRLLWMKLKMKEVIIMSSVHVPWRLNALWRGNIQILE